MFHHNFSLTEIEDMMPWEREIYIGLTMNYLNEEKETNGTRQRKSNGR